jgi:HAMP domain-containing protein
MLRVPRSRGALSGTLLVLLGAWGALIAFVGPYFHYAFTPDHAWTYNTGRLWLEILPGAAAVLGGLIVLVAATRPAAVFGAWVAALSGAWFVVGRPLSTLWTTGHTVAAGQPVGGYITRVAEDIGFFTGLGVVILFFAAMALGRFTVIGAREAAHAAG